MLLASALGAVALVREPAVPADVPPEAAVFYAPHREESGRFFNPWERFTRSTLRLLRWQLSPNEYDKDGEPQVPRVENDGAYLSGAAEPPSLTWVGHATYVGHERGTVFLTDPHWGERALIPRRVSEPGIPLAAVPGHAFAVISHSHYDHLDEWTVEALPASVGWYVPLGLGDWFRERGREDVTELDWWQSAEREGWTITCLPSQHWSLRLGFSTDEALWCAWLIDSGERSYYFAGDTGYFRGFEEVGRRFPGIDAALLPIGAYAPRWFMKYQHMDPAEAYQAFLDLGAREFFAMHWGTFDLTDEPVDYPPQELSSVLGVLGVDRGPVHVPAIGERIVLPR